MRATLFFPMLIACAVEPTDPIAATLSDGGEAQAVAISSARLTDGDAGALELDVTLTVDPICEAADDERYYSLLLTIPDVDLVPLNTDIDLADPGGLLQPSFDVVCYCEEAPEDPSATYSGTIRFTSLTRQAATFDLDVSYQGDTTSGADRDVSIEGAFEAPEILRSDCG